MLPYANFNHSSSKLWHAGEERTTSFSVWNLESLIFISFTFQKLIGAFNSRPIPAICAEAGIMYLQCRRNYLTDRFIARNLIQFHPSLHQDILKIFFKWRLFTHSRLPLICRRAKIISRFKPFMPLPLSTYRQTPSPFIKFKTHPSATFNIK